MNDRFVVKEYARQQIEFPPYEESSVKREFQEEADMRNIVKRWMQTKTLTHVMQEQPTYGDFTSGGDLLEVLNRGEKAWDDFMNLPSNVRDHVDNDPVKFLDMVYDPSRRPELEELGLVEHAEALREPRTAPEAPNPAPAEPAAPTTDEPT